VMRLLGVARAAHDQRQRRRKPRDPDRLIATSKEPRMSGGCQRDGLRAEVKKG
jgi:hypothetical protein